jgi:hypothetical protein
VQFVVLTVPPARNFEVLRLAARFANRLESSRTGGPDRDLGIYRLMMVMIVFLLVLDLDDCAITSEAHDFELGGLLFTLEFNVGADPQLGGNHTMRHDVGKHGATRRLNHEAMSENVGDLAGQPGSFVRHLFLLFLNF